MLFIFILRQEVKKLSLIRSPIFLKQNHNFHKYCTCNLKHFTTSFFNQKSLRIQTWNIFSMYYMWSCVLARPLLSIEVENSQHTRPHIHTCPCLVWKPSVMPTPSQRHTHPINTHISPHQPSNVMPLSSPIACCPLLSIKEWVFLIWLKTFYFVLDYLL